MSGQNTQYISSAGFAPNGGLIGYFTNNGTLTLNQLYNLHQQMSHAAVAYNNNYQTQNYFSQDMDWGTSANNGVRLYGKKEYISSNAPLPSAPTFQQTFSYDGVNRLLTASDTGGWAQSYNYDGYGNMWMPSNGLPNTNQSAPGSNVYNAANNQNPNFQYDAAGNQTTFGSLTLSYDAENRQTQMANLGGGTGTFQYDGLGHRVVKALPSQTTTYVYDAFGQLAAEYYSGTLPTAPCSTCYLTYDYLGSVRMVTDAQGNVIGRHDFAPFGQEIPAGTAGRSSQWGLTSDVDAKFTGQLRDQESGEDFFNARYFTATLGRFNSPDPANAGGSLGSSQSWNGYGYVLGNPLALVDPSGRCTSPDGSTCYDGTSKPACRWWQFWCWGGSSGGTPEDFDQNVTLSLSNAPSTCTNCGGGNAGKSPTPAKTGSCPSPAVQAVALGAIGSNPVTLGSEMLALFASQVTGGTTIVGASSSVSENLLPGETLGRSAGVGLGLAADSSGNLGLAISTRIGGGFKGGPSTSLTGGGSISITRQPTIFGMTGKASPALGLSGSFGSLSGSANYSPTSGSTSVSVGTSLTTGPSTSVSTFGGVSSTTVIPLVCAGTF